MSILQILKWPDARLSMSCAQVGQEDLSLLIQNMFETMYEAGGRGLAAPQIGVMKRMFIMDITWKEAEKTPLVMINPKVITSAQETVVMDEMCLSVPGVSVPVTRPVALTVRYGDVAGNIHTRAFDGAEARVIQHETDHLDGLMHFDRIAPDTREALEEPYLEELT